MTVVRLWCNTHSSCKVPLSHYSTLWHLYESHYCPDIHIQFMFPVSASLLYERAPFRNCPQERLTLTLTLHVLKLEHTTTINDDKKSFRHVLVLFHPRLCFLHGAVRLLRKMKKKNNLLLDIYSTNQPLLISKALFLALNDTFKAFLCWIALFFHAKTQSSLHIWYCMLLIGLIRENTYFTSELST